MSITEEMMLAGARAFAAADQVVFDEQCVQEADPDAECVSDTCPAAFHEDHDALMARAYYLSRAKHVLVGAESVRGGDFLGQLRLVNSARWAVWAQGDAPDPLYQSNEFGGEAGEVMNIVKKLVREGRGWRGSRSSVDKLADEIADCIICLDSLASTYGIDLIEAVVRKFNATSEANGFDHRLVRDASAPDQAA